MQKPYLGEELTEVVRRWARPTTPEELQARGVRSVRSISMDRVAGLIEKAVNRTLLSRTLGGKVEDHETFSEAAREEFVRLVRGKKEAPRTLTERKPEKKPGLSLDDSPAESALGRLKHDLRSRRLELQEQQSALSKGAGLEGSEDHQLEMRLRQIFVAWGGQADELDPLASEVIQASVSELRNERRRSQQKLIDQHRAEMDVLERRLTKLSSELERTEAELARVAAAGLVSDDGLPSIYSEVQGLSGLEEDHERKGALMSAIFEANMELQVKLASPLALEPGPSHSRTEDKQRGVDPMRVADRAENAGGQVASNDGTTGEQKPPVRMLTAMPAPAIPRPPDRE